MIFFLIFNIFCPPANNEEILKFLNSLKTEEEIYQSIKECPLNFLIKEGLSRLSMGEYINKFAIEGDWYIKYLIMPKIKDENFLKEIYLNEKDQIVKDEAIKFIKDEEFLKNVFEKDKNVFALMNIKDQNYLKDFFIKEKNKEMREKILSFIEDDLVLKELLKLTDDNDLIEIIFLKLQNKDVLKDILKEDFQEDIKLKTIDFMDEKTLKEIALKGSLEFKKKALENIKDEIFLRGYFLKTEEMVLKISAIKNIKNQNFLKDLFRNKPDLREYLISNIEDENFLKENFEGLSNELKEKALLKIKDQDFLITVFKKAEIENLKEISLKKIYNKDLLKELYWKENSKNLKKIILYNLKREDQDFYKNVASEEKNFYLKAEALTFIEDEIFIKNEIIKSPSIYLKLKALERISKEDVLKEIYEKEKEWFIKYYVLRKIKDRNFWNKIKERNIRDDLDKENEIEGPIPYEEICVNLNQKYFKELEKIKEIVKGLGENFELKVKPICKERRYFNEEEIYYPPDRGKVFQVNLSFEIFDRNSNFNKKMLFFGRNLAKRENFKKEYGKIDGYFMKYYFPEIDILDFTINILKDYEKEKIMDYKNSKNKYIKAAFLILKSELEAK